MASPDTGSVQPLKVFLSHSTKDGAFVDKLSAALKAAGCDPWHSEVDIGPMSNFVGSISDALRASDLALLIWSSNAANSAWTTAEWTSVLARQIEECTIRLGVVMLQDVPLPELLRTTNYVDARTDPDQAVTRTIQWVQARHDAGRLAGSKASVLLPDYRPDDFVGREDYLKQLRTAFGGEPVLFLLHGEPGSGKSTLALRFAWEAQRDFDAVVFQTCGQRSVDQIGVELAGRLKLNVSGQPPEQQLQAVRQWLGQRQSLLVLDDVCFSDAKELIQVPATSVLVTSRLQSLPWISPKNSVEVGAFSWDEVKGVFANYLGAETTAHHQQALMTFAESVGGLPIAIAVAADLLRRQLDPLDEAAQELRLENLKNEVLDVPGILSRAIESRPEPERRLLAAAGICVPTGFWLPLTIQIAGITEAQGKAARDQLFQSSLLRLLDRDRQIFALPTLLREAVNAESQNGSDLQEAYLASLTQLFRERESRWPECRKCVAEVIPALKLAIAQTARDRITWLGAGGFEISYRMGDYGRALEALSLEASFWTGQQDREAKKSTLRVVGNQAAISKAWGRFEDGLGFLKQAELLAKELDDQPLLRQTLINEALMLTPLGRLQDAMDLLKQVETLCQGPPVDTKMLRECYRNQASIQEDRSKHDDALELIKKCEDLWTGDPDRRRLIGVYNLHAVILKNQGNLGDAMDLHKKVEALCDEFEDLSGLQSCYGNQAIILQAWGKFQDAYDLYQRQEQICRNLKDGQSLQACYANQARLFAAVGQFDNANALFEAQQRICLQLQLPLPLAYGYVNWGLMAKQQGDMKGAREKLQAAIKIFSDLDMPLVRQSAEQELSQIPADPKT